MKKYYYIFICLFIFGNLPFGLAQDTTATITGIITMPVVQKKQRVFRGRMYRNRLSASKKTRTTNNALQSTYLDVIISARPISFKAPVPALPPVKILQINAQFLPRVVPVTPGTEVQFINRDKFFHNVFSITPGSRFNIGRKPTGVVVSRTISKLGETKLFCDIHAQMNATIICLDTAYLVRVRPDGRYQLPDLPPGTYRLQVYHPDFSRITQVVQLQNGQILTANFNLSR